MNFRTCQQLKNKQSSLATPDRGGRHKEEDISKSNKNVDHNHDSTLSPNNSLSINVSNMQSVNHNNQNSDCVGLQNIEIIPPPTYNEATSSSSVLIPEVVHFF